MTLWRSGRFKCRAIWWGSPMVGWPTTLCSCHQLPWNSQLAPKPGAHIFPAFQNAFANSTGPSMSRTFKDCILLPPLLYVISCHSPHTIGFMITSHLKRTWFEASVRREPVVPDEALQPKAKTTLETKQNKTIETKKATMSC